MEHEREEESEEMFSPNESEEYMPHMVTCSELYCPRAEGCPYRRQSLLRQEPPHPKDEFIIQLEVTDDRLTGEATPTSLLVEWRYGATCAEGRSSFEGFGTCAGGWPWAHVSILL